MKRVFLFLLCAAFAMVGCEELELNSGTNNGVENGTENGETPEEPIFVVNAEGDYVISAEGGKVEVVVATNLEYTISIPAEAQEWLSHTDTRSVRQETVEFTIAQNSVDKSRSATVQMLSVEGEVLESLNFVQNAAVLGDMSEIELTANKSSIEIGEIVTFTVTEKSGKNVTASSTIYDGDYTVVQNARYKGSKAGQIKFFATRNGYTSNTVTITVGDGSEQPENPGTEGGAFLHKVLVIDHTGVNCGYCPNAIDNLRNLESKTSWGPYYNEVSCHAGSFANGDPANSEAANMLNGFQGNLIGGYPTIAINFYHGLNSYSYTNIANALQNIVKKDGADVGISLSVDKGTNAVSCSAQIKAAVSAEYKVNAWLLENNIYSPNQSNATKDYHYYYNHALRKTSESVSSADFSGKSIGMLYIGETYDYNCTIPVESSWVMNNLEVLIVVTARNGSGSWDVVNTAVCGVGETVPYAYI